MSEELLEQPGFETLFHVEVAENRRLSDALDGLRAVVKEFVEESVIGRSEEFDHGYHYAQIDLLHSLPEEAK